MVELLVFSRRLRYEQEKFDTFGNAIWGSTVRLIDVIQHLKTFDIEDTIYAAEPWTKDSESLVFPEPPSGGVPPEAAALGMKCFLELAIAQKVLENWSSSRSTAPTALERCERVIKYAKDDA